MNHHRRYVGAVLALAFGALALRVWGAGWSLPYVDHPDEPAVVGVLLRIVQGDLNPRHFFYPSLILYLQALVLKLHLWVGLLSGLYSAPLDLPRSTHFYTTIPAAFMWLRVFTALLSTATVLALTAWGGRLVGTREGLIAGALLALSPWAIVHAHYITVDAPAALFALLALLAALLVLERGTWRDYLLVGLLIGLATGSKYQNVLVVLSFALAHGFRWRRETLQQGGRFALSGLVALVVFLLTSPYIILDFAGFMHDMETLFTSYEAGHGDIGHTWPLAAYLRFHWHEGLGPLPFLLLLVGAVALARRNPPQAAVLLAFPLVMIVLLLRMDTHFYRNLLPAQAPLLLVSGIGAVALWDYGRQYLPARLARPVGALSLAVLLLPSLLSAWQTSARLAWPDSRVVSQEWARREYPGVRIASEQSHPMRRDGVAQSTYLHYLPLRSLEWYQQHGYGLLLANSGRRKQDAWTVDYAPLLEAGTLVFSAGGRDSRYLGPRVDLIDTGLQPDIAPTYPYTRQVQLGPLRLLGATYGRLVDTGAGREMQPGQPVQPGDILAITAFWLVDEPVPPADYTVFVHLRNQQGQNVTQRDAPPWQGLFPPESWPPGKMVVERLDVLLPANLPPGEYRLVLGLYSPAEQTRFAAWRNGERLPHDEVALGTVEIVADAP
jgi:4-amino-4-deoxy-L-arabinose transferase-like glycosyltransferase